MATLVQKCTSCNTPQKLPSFYVNSLNKEGKGHNLWCTKCVKKFVKDKSTMEEYCNENKREFREDLWNLCEERTRIAFSNNVEISSLEETQKQKKFSERTINTYFSQHNQSQYYRYIPNGNEAEYGGDDDVEYSDVKVKKQSNSDDKNYSSKWGGDFTDEELEYLNEQLAFAEREYELKTKNDSEYAMNVAVAGLIVRKARKDYLNGVPGADKRYKEAVAIYDSLCTSSKFNQKTRTENTNTGLGSFGETFKRLEEMGFEAVQITYPRDTVDVILDEYAHSHVALRGALDDGE